MTDARVDNQPIKVKVPEELRGPPEIFIDFGQLKLPAVQSETSQLLHKLPQQIPGIRKITLAVEPSDPELRIVVIKDYHGSAESHVATYRLLEVVKGKLLTAGDRTFVDTFDRSQLDAVGRVQEDIKKALQFFRHTYKLSEIYEEAVFLDAEQDAPVTSRPKDRPRDDVKKAEEKIAKLWEKRDLLLKNAPGEIEKITVAEIEAFEARTRLNEQIRPRASRDLLQDGSLRRIFPSELGEVRKLEPNDNNLMRAFHNLREDVALEIISYCEKKGDRVAFIVFGGDHDFSDNVRKFNEDHSRNVALTVLEPESYQRADTEIESILEKIGKHLEKAP